ncbi:MAG: YitT family protein [Bacilli bacterium]|nr:YitT family protein [Bacilli bacterium]
MGKRVRIIRDIKKAIAKKPRLKIFLEWFYLLVLVTISAFSYALAFRLFINPSLETLTNVSGRQVLFVGGGVSGLSQNFVKLFYDVFGLQTLDRNILQSILYFILNIPVFVLGWLKIGKRFTVFSIINVMLASLFISIIPHSWETAVLYDSQLTRTLYAGILAGFSAAVAFKGNVSSGGMDIIAYYFANRKSEGVGKYNVSFNVIVVTFYFILNLIHPSTTQDVITDPTITSVNVAITSFISSITYLVMTSFVIDLINVRNKKAQVQIITNHEELAQILISNFPHGATTVKGVGVYSNNEKTIIYMTVSSNEVADVVRLIQEVDEKAFVNVSDLRQVFGKFYITPIK